jgi:hypothetical protein
LIELTCTPEKYGSSEYLIIDASKKLIFDNGEKTENVYIDKNRIIFETNDGGSKFVSRIDRTTGKMVSTEPKNPGINLNYSCELVNPKF